MRENEERFEGISRSSGRFRIHQQLHHPHPLPSTHLQFSTLQNKASELALIPQHFHICLLQLKSTIIFHHGRFK